MSLPPFHAGEVALQTRVGAAAQLAAIGAAVIRPFMPDQHRQFYAQLPFLVVGAVDATGDVWASLLSGDAGFASSPDPEHLHLDTAPAPDDPAAAGMGPGAAVGLLGIELATRRRNRVNGVVQPSATGLRVSVQHSFGNCPQYIQRRSLRPVERPVPPPARRHDGLADEVRERIARADTFFVASYVDDPRQVDVSHRGGRPGFIDVAPDGTLTVPDFAGNRFFNTLGNFAVNPRAGLLFVDFATGDLVQLTGDVTLVFDGPEVDAFQGAERLWRFVPRRTVVRPGRLGWVSRDLDPSPNHRATGTWRDARQRLARAAEARQWRRLTVRHAHDESTSVRSLVLDRGALPPHRAGQHVAVRVPIDGEWLTRVYSVSSGPTHDDLRISVKKQGRVSAHLHTLVAGDVLEVRGPMGGFTIEPAAPRPAVLIGTGIGITPLLAMAHHLVDDGRERGVVRPTLLLHGDRDEAQRPFEGELRALAKRAGDAMTYVRYLTRPTGAGGHDVTGRIDLTRWPGVPWAHCDVYVCGPRGFMEDSYAQLRSLGVPDDRVHVEAFGPSTLSRPSARPLRHAPVEVSLDGHPLRWAPQAGNLLALAEASGLQPAFGCRAGSCGTCRVRVTAGRVVHHGASFPCGDGDALLCCASPAADDPGPLVLETP